MTKTAVVLMCLFTGACAAQENAKPQAKPAAQPDPHAAAAQPEALDWKSLEAPLLTRHVQLTTREQFVKAGEAYFSPDCKWVIFQAVAVPKEGAEADPFYAMYVARLKRDRFTEEITGLEEPIRVSPEGSANTCGWFAPGAYEAGKPFSVLFGSTVKRPVDEQKSGFQVGTRKYVWMFPAEMEVVSVAVEPGEGSGAWRAEEPRRVFKRDNYDAECSYSADGRFILYAHIEDGKEGSKPDANIYIYDTKTKKQTPLVVAPGYDGGPFFSPDGQSICYRSDRKGNDLLQLFVADLAFKKDRDGTMIPTGVRQEYQITDNEHVNWAPFWHPSGKFLIYGTSEVGHQNYEVFAIEVSRGKLDGAARGGEYLASVVVQGLRQARITQASGADVLPVFSPDGKYMMWTSQRGPKVEGEERSSSQMWIAEWKGDPFAQREAGAAK